MKIVIRQIHASASKVALNQEWFVVENAGDTPFSTTGCSVSIGRGKGRPKPIGTIDPGFTLAPNERVRVITGNPGKKVHGEPPVVEGLKNYHLFLASPLLPGPGAVLAMSLHQHEITRATFDPTAKDGLSPTTNGAP